MDNMTLIAVASIVTAGLTTGVGCMAPALGEGRSVATALSSLDITDTQVQKSETPGLGRK
jgi:F0F1-type ATP synthase membrane subunit c/vacuolar-type H+-ATPase subunit K